jgi:transcriptional regulator with XRE-family HTH domain
LHLRDNIKLIRALLNQTQKEFIQNFTGISEAMQKSYEGGKAEPGILYIRELAELTGLSEKDLTDKKLSKIDIKRANENAEKVEKVESEDIITFNRDLGKVIGELKEENIYLKARVTVLSVTLAKVISVQTGKAISHVAEELSEAFDLEVAKLLLELKKKP